MKEFLVNKRKRFNTISDTKTNSSLKIHYFTVCARAKPRSEPPVVARLGLPDFTELMGLLILHNKRLFLSICFISTFTFFKSLCQVLKKLLPLTFCLVFDLYLFMKVVKLSLRPLPFTANSSQLFKLSAIFPTSRFTFIYTFVRHSSHHKTVLFLIPRHDRPKEEGKADISLQVV